MNVQEILKTIEDNLARGSHQPQRPYTCTSSDQWLPSYDFYNITRPHAFWTSAFTFILPTCLEIFVTVSCMAVAVAQRQYQTETPDKVLMNDSVVVPVTIGVSRGLKWGGSPTMSEPFAQTNYYKRLDYHAGEHSSTLWGYFQLLLWQQKCFFFSLRPGDISSCSRVFFKEIWGHLCGNQNR